MPEQRNPEDYLPLHPLEFRILMATLRGPTYGTRIVDEIEQASHGGPTIYPANLFRRIRELLSSGLLEDAQAPPDADSRRNYLQITPLGRGVAGAEAARLQALVADAARHDLLAGR